MRDVFFGLLTWVLAIGVMVAIIVCMTHFVGPPITDRHRSFLFIGGGGAVFVALLIVLGIAFVANSK